MPTINIVRKNDLKRSFRVDSIIDRHELNPRSADVNYSVNLPLEERPWRIGVIVGSSGSGKTTIAKEIFKEEYVKESLFNDDAIIDEMPKSRTIDEISRAFNSVGFGTIWNWLKPYKVLSRGEQMRVDIAQAILSDQKLIVFDEFTSVVDREIAKVASCSISKAIRKSDKQFVAVTCHRDIIEWLEPDWIYDTDKQRFFFVQENTGGLKYRLISAKYQGQIGPSLSSFTI